MVIFIQLHFTIIQAELLSVNYYFNVYRDKQINYISIMIKIESKQSYIIVVFTTTQLPVL